MWPYIFGTACCGVEYMSVLGPKYDIARFGAEVVRFSPRQADLLVVAGTITEKMAPALKQAKYTEAILLAVADIGQVLAKEFPWREGDKDELPNRVARDSDGEG